LRWTRYQSPERYVDLDRALNLTKWPLRETPGGASPKVLEDAEVTCYAFSHIYSPDERRVHLRFTRDNNGKAWLNGQLVSAVHDHQGVTEMRDECAFVVDTHLQRGWNTILLKINRAERPTSGVYGFIFRIANAEKQNLPDIVYSADKLSVEDLQ